MHGSSDGQNGVASILEDDQSSSPSSLSSSVRADHFDELVEEYDGKLLTMTIEEALHIMGLPASKYDRLRQAMLEFPDASRRQIMDHFRSGNIEWYHQISSEPVPQPCQSNFSLYHVTPQRFRPLPEYPPDILLATIDTYEGLDWSHILIVVTAANRGASDYHPEIMDFNGTLRRALHNSVLVLKYQHTRHFVPSITFCQDAAFISIVGRQSIRILQLPDYWEPQKFADLAAMMQCISLSGLENFGLSPLFDFTPTAHQPALVPTAVKSHLFDIPQTALVSTHRCLTLSPIHIHHSRGIRGRTTLINRLQTSPPYILKVQSVETANKGKEAIMYNLIADLNLKHVIKLHFSKIFEPLSCQHIAPVVLNLHPSIELRHYEMHLYEDVQGIRIDDHRAQFTPTQLLQGLTGILQAVEQMWRERKVLHRDISTGNILVTPTGAFYLTDWDCALQVSADTALTTRTEMIGTLDTMAAERLMYTEYYPHSPRHDAESVVSVLFKVIALRFIHTGFHAKDKNLSMWQGLLFGPYGARAGPSAFGIVRRAMLSRWMNGDEAIDARRPISNDLADILDALVELAIPRYHRNQGRPVPFTCPPDSCVEEAFYQLIGDLVRILARPVAWTEELQTRWGDGILK